MDVGWRTTAHEPRTSLVLWHTDAHRNDHLLGSALWDHNVGSSDDDLAVGTVELVQPTTDTSGMARYMLKRGPGMHHICLEVEHIEETLARLKKKGIQLINEEPTVGAGGKKIAFIHPKSTGGVLVELYE